jgi:hypothetical protein
MSRQVQSRREIDEWHRQFELLRQEWVLWLEDNGAKYQTTAEAWSAFSLVSHQYQSRENPTISDLNQCLKPLSQRL